MATIFTVSAKDFYPKPEAVKPAPTPTAPAPKPAAPVEAPKQ